MRLTKKIFPFIYYSKKNHKDQLQRPIPFGNREITTDELLQFVKKELNLNLLLKGCLQEWNEIVADFLTLSKEK